MTPKPLVGAIDVDNCPSKRRPGGTCRCGPCAECGWGPHMAIHGPKYGQLPGTEPWGHLYQEGGALHDRPH